MTYIFSNESPINSQKRLDETNIVAVGNLYAVDGKKPPYELFKFRIKFAFLALIHASVVSHL